MTPTDPSHRRDFVRALALGAIAAPAAIADEPKRADDKDKDKDKPKAEPPRPPDEVDARMAIVLARFGKHAQLDEKARATIRGQVEAVIRRGEALRKLPLGNGDGPFPVFHPYRAPLS